MRKHTHKESSMIAAKVANERQKFVDGVPWGKTPEEHRKYHAWYRSMDRERYNKKSREWSEKNRDKRNDQARSSYLKYKFNITLEEYNRILKESNYSCGACGQERTETKDKKGRRRTNLHLDHDHATGKVRGILCHNCNVTLGLMKDCPERIAKLAEYIKKVDDKSIHIRDIDTL